MKIRSDFKDYYDYVAKKYGAGDEDDIVYNRTRIVPLTTPDYKGATPMDCPKIITPDPIYFPSPKKTPIEKGTTSVQTTNYALIVFCNRLLLAYRVVETSVGYMQHDPRYYSRVISDWRVFSDQQQYNQKVAAEYGSEYAANWAEKLCFTEGHPVMMVLRGYDGYRSSAFTLHLESRPPNLGQMGMHRILTAEQAYQELAMFIGRMQFDPSKPKDTMTSKEKIVSHGFDLKQSFRHRK